MKRFFLSILIISGVTIAFNSCNNGAYNADPSGNVSMAPNPIWVAPGINVSSNSTDYFNAKINGVPYNAPTIITATYDTIQYVYGLTVGSGNTSHKIFTLGIINFNSFDTGTYNIPNSKIIIEYFDSTVTSATALENMQTITGSIVVSHKTSNSISGTFIFSRYDSMQITGGTFGASW